MKPEINIIPLPNYLKKEEGEYKLTSTSEVSLIIENSTAASMLKNQLETAFLIAGIKSTETGTPVKVEILPA